MTDKEKLEKLKKLADAMYYAANYLTTDASRLHKAMDKYHKFIIHEYKEEPKDKCKGCNNVKGCITRVDGSEYAHIEECDITGIKSKEATGKLKELVDNVSEEGLEEARKQLEELTKECMYSKGNYTDEDRKALCDGCEEECIEKINEERKRDLSLWSLGDFENNFFEIIKPYKDSRNYKNLCIRLVVWRSELWRWIHWKKRKEEPVSEDLEKAARKYAGIPEDSPHDLKYCVQDKKAKYDAVLYGANWQKEQLLAKAFDFTKEHNTACVLASECLRNHGWFNRERDFNDLFRHLSCVDKLFEGKFSGKTKVIVIKED